MLDSTRHFLDVVSRSGLVAPEELVRLFSESTHGSSDTDVGEATRLLMRNGRLTAWQIERLQVGQTSGLVLGNYELLEPIGRGGMGEIFKARHRHLDRIVALKTVLRTDLDDSDHIARFHREMRALERLDHPRIVRVYDAGSDEGTWFLVMEYIAGENLHSYQERVGPLSIREAIDMIIQVADGLIYAHQKGIIHRDIKPANLMRCDDGTLKILDLGLARVLEDSLDGRSIEPLTRKQEFLGTVGFISPEQIEDSTNADERSDIHSLGCTLYWLLTGQLITRGNTPTERLAGILNGTRPRLLAVRPDIPTALEGVFQRMVARNASDRLATMTEVASELQTLQEAELGTTNRSARSGEPLGNCPQDSSKQSSWRGQRRTVTVGLVTTAVIFAVIMGRMFWRDVEPVRYVKPESTLEFDGDLVNRQTWGSEGMQGGVYFLESLQERGVAYFRCKLEDHKTYEVVGRVCEGSKASVRVALKHNKDRRVILRIDETGAVFIEGDLLDPNRYSGQSLGPLLHLTALSAGYENTIRAAIDGRHLNLYVNGVSCGPPIALLDRPNRLLLGIATSPNSPGRVEYERIIVWPTIDQTELPPR